MKNSLLFTLSFLMFFSIYAQDYEQNYYRGSGGYWVNEAKSFVMNDTTPEIYNFHKKVVWGNYAAPTQSNNGFFLFAINQSNQIIKNFTIPTIGISSGFPIARAQRIIKTSDHGYIMIGNYFTQSGTYAIYVLKVDNNLNYQWSKSLEELDFDTFIFGYDIIQHSTGSYYIVGRIKGPSLEDVLLIKLSSIGSTQLQRTYDIGEVDYGRSLKEADGGDILITGRSDGGINGAINVLNMRVESNGNLDWAYILDPGYEYEGEGNFITQDPLSNTDFYIGGYLNRLGTGDFLLKNKNFLLVKIDDQGQIYWGKIYGGDEDEVCLHVDPKVSGSSVELSLVGYTESFGNGNEDILYIRTDDNGDDIQSLTYGGTLDDRSFEVKEDDIHYSMVGFRGVPVPFTGNQEYANVIGFKNIGALTCADHPDITSNSPEFDNIDATPNTDPSISISNNTGGIPIVTVINQVNECNTAFPARYSQHFGETNKSLTNLIVYPNPVSSHKTVLKYTLTKESPVSIKIVNSIGKTALVPDLNLPYNEGTHTVKIDISSLASGLYLVVLETQDEQKIQKFIIK